MAKGASGQASALHVQELRHCYKAEGHGKTVPVLKGVDLELFPGELGCLLGPSGCGKTTLLRSIAGFEQPDAGTIHVGGRAVFVGDQTGGHGRPELTLEPELRRVGMVFQDYALFPHLNVQDNITFGLRSLSPSQRQQKVKELAEALRLSPDLWQRFPHELSGGQQQRVALARALAPGPQLLLLDEPFSNLDPRLRAEMRGELKDMLKAWAVTALFVTHDQEEAFELSDKLGLMQDGKILQWGLPEELYRQPKALEVAQFFGEGFVLDAQVEASNGPTQSYQLCTEFGYVPHRPSEESRDLKVFVRPENWRWSETEFVGGVKVEILDRRFRGAFERLYFLSPQSQRLMYLDSPKGSAQKRIYLGLSEEWINIF